MARKRKEYSKEIYMAALAELRYVQGVRPAIAAKRVGLGQSTANRYLKEAWDLDYIERPALTFPLSIDERYKTELLKKGYDVEEWVVVPGWPKSKWADGSRVHTSHFEDVHRRTLGHAAARYLEGFAFQDGDHLAIGPGKTMLAMANVMNLSDRAVHVEPTMDGGFHESWVRLTLRPIVVDGACAKQDYADASAVLRRIVEKNREVLRHYPEFLSVNCPAVPPELLGLALETPQVASIFGSQASRPAFVICSLGHTGYDRKPAEPSSFVKRVAESLRYRAGLEQPNYDDAKRFLDEAKIIGEFSGYAVDSEGRIVDGILDKTSLAVHPEMIRKWKELGTYVIVVAGTRESAQITAWVGTHGYANAAIVDAALAEELCGFTYELPRRGPRVRDL